MTAAKLNTRAVLRVTQPGSYEPCAHCAQTVGFKATKGLRQVIANVYEGRPRRWVRVETFHEGCYQEAGMPHGDVDAGMMKARR